MIIFEQALSHFVGVNVQSFGGNHLALRLAQEPEIVKVVCNNSVVAFQKTLPHFQPLPPGGDAAAVWFDDFVEVRDPLRLRTFGEVDSDDAFSRWQGELQKALAGKVRFQTSVSFARTGRK